MKIGYSVDNCSFYLCIVQHSEFSSNLTHIANENAEMIYLYENFLQPAIAQSTLMYYFHMIINNFKDSIYSPY